MLVGILGDVETFFGWQQRFGRSKSLREIGELFGGLDYAAVAQRIRRTKSTYNLIAARRLITAMLNV